eukprot:PhF_6_TR40818/c4_g1_i3/m.61737
MFPLHQYNNNGTFVIKQFASPDEVGEMKSQMRTLLSTWNPQESINSIFSTVEEDHVRNEYFTNSAENISFFLEPDAVLKPGTLRTDLPKEGLVNKAGHALHVLDPVFRKYSTSQKVKQL